MTDTENMMEKGEAAISKANDGAKSILSEVKAGARVPHDHREGGIARSIENQTARLPSDIFLWAAGGSIALSALFQARGRSGAASFVGHWAPTFLLLGIYNKIVKVAGSDKESRGSGLDVMKDSNAASLH